MIQVESLIKEIDHLKPVSSVASKVMALLDDPDSGMSDLVEIIQYEPAITSNVLKLANSAYFGLPGKIKDAKQAIIYLGMAQVIELVLMVCCSGTFNGSHDGYEAAGGDLWKNAVSGAILSNNLSEIQGKGNISVAFTGALLRDIGKIIMDPYVLTDKEKLLDYVHTQGGTFLSAERRVLGFDHAQIGAMIAKKWNFPSELQCVIRFYHTPFEAKACNVEALIVNLADTICRKMEIGCGMDDPFLPEEENVIDSLGLSEGQIENVIDGFSSKMEQVDAIFAG